MADEASAPVGERGGLNAKVAKGLDGVEDEGGGGLVASGDGVESGEKDGAARGDSGLSEEGVSHKVGFDVFGVADVDDELMAARRESGQGAEFGGADIASQSAQKNISKAGHGLHGSAQFGNERQAGADGLKPSEVESFEIGPSEVGEQGFYIADIGTAVSDLEPVKVFERAMLQRAFGDKPAIDRKGPEAGESTGHVKQILRIGVKAKVRHGVSDLEHIEILHLPESS